MKKINLQQIPTETPNTKTAHLDKLTPLGLARVFNAQDFNAARAVKSAACEIAQVIILAAQAYAQKHKIIFIGAGTSGRLGILEAVECVPTFGTKPNEIIGLIAGGNKAVFRAQEGAEDDAKAGARDIKRAAHAGDLVIGLTASGRTPYVLGALAAAKKIHAKTALMACNPHADVSCADVFIYLPTGAEALTGSTRMKAGTATKMALNAITTGAMTLCGKTYGNLMVDVRPTNKKLVARAERLIGMLTGADEKTAAALLRSSGGKVKTAVVMARKKVSRRAAEKQLREADGFLTRVIDA
jgi:N-acetylmuramic acid 6-phosphate etherase